MREGLTLAELYPPVQRAALINWVGAAGPDELAPSDAVREHLEPQFRAAARQGRRAGVRLGLVPWILLVAVVVVAIVIGPTA
ncbi:hypothetical protein [Pseudonocardia sp.]|uniref:hypothetical protein n=1 Tax=Pseudonocardia sp. TaxID=60912 RepID=UPI003D0EA668